MTNPQRMVLENLAAGRHGADGDAPSGMDYVRVLHELHAQGWITQRGAITDVGRQALERCGQRWPSDD